MRIIQVKIEGKWTYTKTVADDQANRIVRALNKEGHTARSLKVKPEVKSSPMRSPRSAREGNAPSFPKSMSAKPSRMRVHRHELIPQTPAPDVTLLDLNDVVEGPTVADITKAVRNVAKANRIAQTKIDSELTAAQLAAMLRIEGAGRMEDPARCGLKIHAATLRALVLRGVVLIGLNDSLHLSVPGRRALLAAIAAIVAPNAERK